MVGPLEVLTSLKSSSMLKSTAITGWSENPPIATENVLENTVMGRSTQTTVFSRSGILYFLFMLTRAVLMPSIVSKAFQIHQSGRHGGTYCAARDDTTPTVLYDTLSHLHLFKLDYDGCAPPP